MSRVGKLPVQIPSGVSVAIEPGKISVTGPKGTLTQFTMPDISIKQEGETLVVGRVSDQPKIRSKHGLMRALLQNMVVGFSHEVVYKLSEGVTAAIEQNTLTITGADKQQVGQVAAEIRALKKPEPYKGKGISYQGERILRKSGKSGKEKA